MTKFAKFKIGDLFTNIKQGSRLTKGDQIPGILPFVMSGTTNTGISNYISNSVEVFPMNSLTVDIFGNTFYRGYEFGMGDDTGALWNEDNCYDRRQMLYLATAIQKSLSGLFDYGHKLRSSQIAPYEIYLPITQTGEIDFEHMVKYIRELEHARIRELDAYLKVSGLSDYALTDKDRALLKKFREGGGATKLFRVGDLFDIVVRGKRIKFLDRESGDLPFITAGVGEMGFSSYISRNQTEVFPKNSLTIDMFGSTFFRGYEYGADDHITVLYDTRKNYSRHVLHYIATSINKITKGTFTYSRNFYPKDALPIEVALPVNQQSEPDTDLMERFIAIQQKLTIRNVVEWKDKEIETTRNLVVH